uniref:Uncharacterized protein n=1 Tax=Sphaerodactylus townsendi TaxID=933632 RepID=A0ACB8EMW2_9SAUR
MGWGQNILQTCYKMFSVTCVERANIYLREHTGLPNGPNTTLRDNFKSRKWHGGREAEACFARISQSHPSGGQKLRETHNSNLTVAQCEDPRCNLGAPKGVKQSGH